MKLNVPGRSKPLRWLLPSFIIGLMIVAVVVCVFYPRYRARQWQEKLLVTATIDEAHALIGEMIRARNPYADAVLTEHANTLDNLVFAKRHRVVLMFSKTTGQPFSVTRWSVDNKRPNITSKFVHPRIVENLPEAVTIAATNEVDGSTCLFFYTYKRTVYACDLTAEELKQFEQNGYWNEYVTRQGDPIDEKRQKKSWNKAEEESYQQWRLEMNQVFKDSDANEHPDSPADNGKQQDSDENVATNSDGKNTQQPLAAIYAIYVYADRRRAAQDYSKLLQEYGVNVFVVRADDLDKSLFEGKDLVLIGSDTGPVWQTKLARNIITASDLPVLGMGVGGYQLFGELGLQIGRPNGVAGDVTQIRPDSEAIFWDAFRPKLVNGLHDCFSDGGQISIKSDRSIDGVIPIAVEGERDGHFPLIVQKPYYVFWGFNGTLDQMTSTGHELFPWACHYAVAMKQHPDRAFTPRSAVERIRKGRDKQ